MLNFNTKILFDGKEKNKAIFTSINIDNKFNLECITKTKISLSNDMVIVNINSSHIQYMRASINSILRLIQTSHDSIESVKIYEK